VRRRYVWDPDLGRTVEVTPEYVGQRRDEGRRSEEEVYGHAVATDGTDLSTKRRHREYMQRNGLAMASDYEGGYWQKKGAELNAIRTPGSGHDSRERRETVGRLAYELSKRGRR
jgi:hypothetical protein